MTLLMFIMMPVIQEKIYQEEMSFMPEFITLINTNHLPIITDETLFTSGRIVVIPFRKHFEEHEQDKGLKRRLKRKQNISGFFNWCVAGYQKYLKDGLETTESMDQEIESYRMNSDKIAATAILRFRQRRQQRKCQKQFFCT